MLLIILWFLIDYQQIILNFHEMLNDIQFISLTIEKKIFFFLKKAAKATGFIETKETHNIIWRTSDTKHLVPCLSLQTKQY
jgi:hypothetical protein